MGKFSDWNREFLDRRVPALFSTELANQDGLVTYLEKILIHFGDTVP
jgi:hypothetical protein